jgi:hypothetical protein
MHICSMLDLSFRKQNQINQGESEPDLSFDEICPIWSNKIRNGIDEIDRAILVRDSKYCIVGEAWAFTGRQTGYYLAPLIPIIGCWGCIKYGQKFSKAARHHQKLDSLTSEFVNHWNQNHKKFGKSKRNAISMKTSIDIIS